MRLDPVLHQPARLRIVGFLARNRQASFADLRDGLELTEGNLGSHLRRLEAAGYVASRTSLSGVGVQARHALTARGAQALADYVAALQRILGAGEDG